jgi:hypothetical protein
MVGLTVFAIGLSVLEVEGQIAEWPSAVSASEALCVPLFLKRAQAVLENPI